MGSSRKQQKVDIVESLAPKLSSVKSTLIIDYQGLSAKNMDRLRESVAKYHNRIQAVKKSLLKIALEKAGQDDLAKKDFSGQTAVVLVEENSVETVKALDAFAKEHAGPRFITGLFEGAVLESQEFKKLAASASKETLLAQTAALVKNPINRLILQTKANQQKLVYVLNVLRR